MDALQVPGQSADIAGMDSDYQQMGSEERERHHDQLRDDGYEWCPECGGTLVWELPQAPQRSQQADSVPVITGDYPPLTAEQLLASVPLS